MIRPLLLLLPVVLLAAPAAAAPAPPPERISQLTVYGNDPCPKGAGDEIVVCARLPEGERYRLPKRFRGKKAEASAGGRAWGSRVETLETASRTSAGLPNSCSAVGSGGFTGCYSQLLAQARAERRQAKAEASDIP